MLLMTLLAACDVPYDVPRTPPDGGKTYSVPDAWQRVRGDMVKAKACFAERRPYCITDRDVLDEAIQLDLDAHFHNRMPRNERWLDELMGRSRANWNDNMRTKHRKRVQERVQENWDQPARAKQGPRVDVSLFVPPGTLTNVKNEWRIDSNFVANGEIVTPELARQLDRYRDQYPNMPVVRLLIDAPVQNGIGFRRWDVRHHLESNRVILADPTDPGGAWVSAPLTSAQFLPYLDNSASLRTRDLERCALPEAHKAPPDCSRHPVYDPKLKRQQPARRGGDRPGWSPAKSKDADGI